MSDLASLVAMARRVGYIEGRTQLRDSILKTISLVDGETSFAALDEKQAKELLILIFRALLDSIEEEQHEQKS